MTGPHHCGPRGAARLALLLAALAGCAGHAGAADNRSDADRAKPHDARADTRRSHDAGDRNDRRRYDQEHYWRYQQPVYAPPPVQYAPEPSPGINLVLPLEIRVR